MLDALVVSVMVAAMSDLSILLLGLLSAFCIGLSKAGFSGISMVSVFLLADMYGAKESVGLALPLLILADLLAYPAFIRHGSWAPVWRLLGPTLLGVALACWMLFRIDNEVAKPVIGGCVLLMVVLQASRRLNPDWFDRAVQHRGVGFAAGSLGGFATMLANAAGPVVQLYLLARQIPKMELIGIGARFFLVVNLLKVPLMLVVPLDDDLPMINSESLLVDLKLAPAVVAGVFGGRWLVRYVPQRLFEWTIVVFSVIAGIRLLFW